MNNPIPRKIVVGITGASGAIYAERLIQALYHQAEVQIHLAVSPLGLRLIHDELGHRSISDLLSAAGIPAEANNLSTDQSPDAPIILHGQQNMGATIASGSFKHDGMIIAPCSSNSLAAIATAQSQHLIHRAAYVTLKERRKLILLHRESPLTLADIRNMETLTLSGATIMPASPSFYTMPKTIDDLVNHVIARILDQLDIPHTLAPTWEDQLQKTKQQKQI
ncbi:UbiX family flavin prenyltransferase [Poriferisphaera sp. WC338]|uniref:UbiX family flavin prenyltransferase n=1 Tax=Poriferisphaera sp. WC338 TaxID=3425129 RepID=UPI003D812928